MHFTKLLAQIIYAPRGDTWLERQDSGLCAGPHERTLRESGNRMFLDAETTGESIRAIVLPKDRCLSYKKETYGLGGLCINRVPKDTDHLPSSIDSCVKKVPATAAVMRQASVAAMRALKPIAEMSFVRFGTRAAVPPTNTAREAKWANPLRA